jgi:predicted nucleic acid-binding protein
MYTLDTNAIIYYLKNEPKAFPVLRKIFGLEVPIFISTISLIELLGYPELNEFERSAIETLIQSLNIVPVDLTIARLAAKLRHLYSLKVPDSAIAATALFTGTTLVTRNIKDFKKIPNLKLLKI